MTWAAQLHDEPVITAEDLEDAREMMRGGDGPALSLRETAQVLGVGTADLDLAMWRSMGAGHA